MNRLFLLLLAVLLCGGATFAKANDEMDNIVVDGDSPDITIEQRDGTLTIRFPKSAKGGVREEKQHALVRQGKGLLNKATGTYYEPAGRAGYRNTRTGEVERAWTCYPAR